LIPSREQLVHELYEAAELEHTLMCTYLYAAFSLKRGEKEGLLPTEANAVEGWRRSILRIATEEMGHLVAVWNITAALGAAPRFGRGNFPLDPGALPAGVVVRLAPFSEAVLQHFIHLERPEGSEESDGDGFAPELRFSRNAVTRITPMAFDYDTVGSFYTMLGEHLRLFVERHGESVAFCGDPALQLSANEAQLGGVQPVICAKTAAQALNAIIEQGEGAREESLESHFRRFRSIREELTVLKANNSQFEPAYPAAHNPVLRPPLRPGGRVWIEDEQAAAVVDIGNSAYGLMLRLIAESYLIARPSPEKSLVVDLAIGLMRAVTQLGELAARLPAGPSNPNCNAGLSFTALRDSAALPPGASARRYLLERLEEITAGAQALAQTGNPRAVDASRMLQELQKVAAAGFRSKSQSGVEASTSDAAASNASSMPSPANGAGPARTIPSPQVIDGVDYIEGAGLTLIYDGKKCIHSRACVTGAPDVFKANVKGPWIDPDSIELASLVEIAHACPSGAIRYHRKDSAADERPPHVNLLCIREAGPYAVRAELQLDAAPNGSFRATLCRCGASKNKPFCDGSHRDIGFSATGEPPTSSSEALEVRNGPLRIDQQLDGPLRVHGNLEITSGTGRIVARLTQARLCRCGASDNKPFCDGSHARIGFRST